MPTRPRSSVGSPTTRPYQVGGLFTSTENVEQRPEVVEAFVRAYQRGAQDYNDAMFQTDADGNPVYDEAAEEIIAIIDSYVYPDESNIANVQERRRLHRSAGAPGRGRHLPAGTNGTRPKGLVERDGRPGQLPGAGLRRRPFQPADRVRNRGRRPVPNDGPAVRAP